MSAVSGHCVGKTRRHVFKTNFWWHQKCQNLQLSKYAYTPEVCHRITWAIIIDSCSFFDDIKLVEDFLESGQYMQFPVSMLQGDYMAIKHGIKIQRHNFPQEWITKEFPTPTGSYYGGGQGGGYQLIPPGILLGTPLMWGKPISPSKVPSAGVVPYRW
jgi:hypothetical protein